MRLLDFFDGAQSETTPTIGNIVASGIIVYPDDATYEASEQGAPAEGNIYFNSTTNFLRYYNGSTWIDIVDDESLQTIANKTIQTSTIDADVNTITNLEDDNIKAGAAIDVTKLHDGSVDNTEFGHLDGVTSNIQTQLNGKQDTSEKDQPNGYAGLDANGRISASAVPEGFLQYQGTWDASTNTPTLADGVGEQGDVYRVSVAGTQDLGSGSISFSVGDWVTYNGTIWERSDFVGAGNMTDLADVDTTGVADRDQLIYNQGAGEWQPSRAALDELSDVDLTTTPPTAGDGLVYDGSNWIPGTVSATGGGGINYITNSQFEDDIADWNEYNDGAVAEPVDGVGGSSSQFGLFREVVNAIRGGGSLHLAKSAFNQQGVGASTDFQIDIADTETLLQVSFDYKPTTALYQSGDLRVFVYDIDNATLIGAVSNGDNGDVVYHDQPSGRFIGHFETTDSLNYRLIFHVASTNTDGWDVYVDNVKVGPSNFVQATVERQEEINLAGSGQFTGGTLFVSRTGNNVKLRISSTATFASASVVTSGSNLLPEWAFPSGDNFNISSAGSSFITFCRANNAGTFQLVFRDYSGTPSAQTSAAVGLGISYDVSGSSAVVSDTELLQQTIKVSARGNGGTAITANVTDIDFTETNDPFNAWNGTQFTAPRSGYYEAKGCVFFSPAAETVPVAYINGVVDKRVGYNGGDIVGVHFFNWQGELAKGDQLSIRNEVSATLGNVPTSHWIEISSLPDFTTYGVYSGGASASVGAPVALIVEQNSGVSINDTAWTFMPFQVQVENSGFTYSTLTGEIEILEDGLYQVNTMIAFAANASGIRQVKITKNGVDLRFGQNQNAATGGNAGAAQLCSLESFVAGDMIRVAALQTSGGTLSSLGLGSATYCMIHKVK